MTFKFAQIGLSCNYNFAFNLQFVYKCRQTHLVWIYNMSHLLPRTKIHETKIHRIATLYEGIAQ